MTRPLDKLTTAERTELAEEVRNSMPPKVRAGGDAPEDQVLSLWRAHCVDAQRQALKTVSHWLETGWWK